MQTNETQQQKGNRYLQDREGNFSSKRLGTFMLVGAFIGVTVEVLICSPLGVTLANKDLLMKILEWSAIGSGVGMTACVGAYLSKKRGAP